MTLRSDSPTRVIKLGGSLLDLPDLATRFHRWLTSQPPAMNLIVVGGGQLVEAMRALDRHHSFDPREMHWWCVDLLETTARLAAALLPDASLLESPSALQSIVQKGMRDESVPPHYIIPPSLFYLPDTASEERSLVDSLPQDWSTTTDSIAALLVIHVQAKELVLLKSISASNGTQEIQQWCEHGLVDRTLPLLASRLPHIRLVNLRQNYETASDLGEAAT